jgi:PadR family transcriptional regulator PadR
MRNANHKWQANIGKEMRRGILSVLLLWILKRKGTPMYGYEIIQTIDRTTKGNWVPKAGTIYPILRRLENKGYVRSEWSSSKSTGPSRRYYRITPEGKEAARKIFVEWKRHMSGFRGFLVDLLGVN